jgi:hypothetical protein
MPFVSSVRGTFGPTSENKGVATGSQAGELIRQDPNSPGLPSGGTVSVAGGYRIHTFRTVGSATFATNSLAVSAEVFAYGAGGASGSVNWGAASGWSYGGGGGFSGGTISAAAGASYLVKVGGTGIFANGATLNEGGGAGGTNWGNGGGGGLSGIFSSNTYSYANAVLIAGGGGGGGTSRASGQTVNRGGGGGGTTGQDGTSYSGNRQGRGGTSSTYQLPAATEYSSSGWFAPGQLTGGHPEPHGGGGGGGYWGGSGGAYYEPNDMGGGGGGSSYSSGAVTGATLTQASYQTPGNTGGTYYNSSYGPGNSSASNSNGTQGQVVIRYLL